jgi:hypothetical protein
MDIQQIIDEITTCECVNCKFGKALIALKTLRDESAPEVPPAAPKIKLQPKTAKTPIRTGTKNGAAGYPKKCNGCGKTKNLDDFPTNKQCVGGHAGTCKVCIYERAKKRAAAKKPSNAAAIPEVQHSLATHPHECKECGKRFLTFVGLNDHKQKRHGAAA